MKLTDSDKHYISEYYLRKGYTVVRKGTTNPILQLTKRGSRVTCTKTYMGIPVRDFIENINKFLSEYEKNK